jgi:hypothetical protein
MIRSKYHMPNLLNLSRLSRYLYPALPIGITLENKAFLLNH